MIAAIERELAIAHPGQIVFSEQSLAGGRPVEAAQDVEEGRFAGPRRAEKHQDFGTVDVEIATPRSACTSTSPAP
jgi:hypothetical protein